MRPSRDAPAFKAGAGPFRRTLSSKHYLRTEAAGLEPAWAAFATPWLGASGFRVGRFPEIGIAVGQ